MSEVRDERATACSLRARDVQGPRGELTAVEHNAIPRMGRKGRGSGRSGQLRAAAVVVPDRATASLETAGVKSAGTVGDDVVDAVGPVGAIDVVVDDQMVGFRSASGVGKLKRGDPTRQLATK